MVDFKRLYLSKENIYVPTSLETDDAGFTWLANLWEITKQSKSYNLDFQHTSRFEGNLCAILGAIVTLRRTEGCRFSVSNIQSDQLNQTLSNNGFLGIFKNGNRASSKNSSIPFQQFDMTNESVVEAYIYDHVLLSERVPEMSEQARKKVFRSIFEIYQNSVMHSGADNLFVCGQYYFHKKRMALTMVEFGRTFKENVCKHDSKFQKYSGVEAIEWAVISGNTTKVAEETGGLGLDVIRDFLRMNEGKLQIRSADGYWEEKKGINFAKDCTNQFSGSVVNIEFNLRDENIYYAKEEIDPNSLF